MYVTFVVFTDCESCTKADFTNPVSMEAGEYGPTCGARFLAVCLEVVAVAGLLWSSWDILGAAEFISFFLFFERTRSATSMRTPCLIYLSTSNEARPRERSDQGSFFAFREKKPLYTGVRTGCHYLISLSVCVSVNV